MEPEDEYLDLVSEGDEVIGKELRSVVYAKKLSNFRVINAFVRRLDGKLWIPRRTAQKRIFPLCLDMSLGGHVESGETYEQAFRRELQEELNMDAFKVPFKELGKLTPQEHGVSAFMKVYEIPVSGDPNYNRNDFTEAAWFSPAELLSKLAAGEKCKDDLPKLVSIFYVDKT